MQRINLIPKIDTQFSSEVKYMTSYTPLACTRGWHCAGSYKEGSSIYIDPCADPESFVRGGPNFFFLSSFFFLVDEGTEE